MCVAGREGNAGMDGTESQDERKTGLFLENKQMQRRDQKQRGTPLKETPKPLQGSLESPKSRGFLNSPLRRRKKAAVAV